ncbi:MAG: hypothetical protein MUF54_02935 [Polyangiaceae bacterium]|jgi:hypothetical protein|nr:hypothetical protein [Polyangiaceae bacterium]
MDNKISRRGFLALIFGGIAALFVSQLPGQVFAKKQAEKGYGSSAYGR